MKFIWSQKSPSGSVVNMTVSMTGDDDVSTDQRLNELEMLMFFMSSLKLGYSCDSPGFKPFIWFKTNSQNNVSITSKGQYVSQIASLTQTDPK